MPTPQPLPRLHTHQEDTLTTTSRRSPTTVAVDFDGVVHAYTCGWQDGTIYDPPLPGAIDGLRALMAHHAVFIHTSRDAHQVASWLAEHGLDTTTDSAENTPRFWSHQDRVLVTNRKLPAVAYLDDRAIRFTTWPDALTQLTPTAGGA